MIGFREGISQKWLVLFVWVCFHVSGERGVPTGGAGEYPEILLGGAKVELFYHLRVEGGGFEEVLMGHSDIGVMLNTYTHFGLEDVADELKRMEDLAIARKELEKAKGEKPVSQKMFRAI